MALVRMNISTSDEVKEWYQVQAQEYGISMSALMSFVLTQYKKNEESREILRELNHLSKTMDTGKMLEDMKSIMQSVNAGDSFDLPLERIEKE